MRDYDITSVAEAVDVHLRKQAVLEHLYRVCEAIDNFDCKTWLDCFTESCRYRMVPRENFDRGLPLCLIDDDRAGMLQRAKLIQELWQYEPFRETRLLANVKVSSPTEESASAKAALAVYRTTSEGESCLHMIARIEDQLVNVGGQGWKIQDRLVILESFKVPNNIILPA